MTDYTVADTIYLMFTTRAFATGIPTVLAGTPVVSAYENDSATQITAGITLGVSHDSVVGMNLLTIVATGANGYEAGKDYNMVITTGTVDSVSVVGEVVGTFSLSRSAAAVDLANATDGLTALRTLLLDIPTVAEFNARTLLAASYFDASADTVANVTTVATLTGHTVQSGDSFARIGAAGASLTALAQAAVCTEARLAELAAANLPADVDTLLSRLTAARATNLDEITAVRMATLTDWIDGGRLDLILDSTVALFTTQLTESYNADGTAFTPAQALFLIVSYLMERSVSGTTVTARQLDGSTTAATFTLDSSTAPTSVTRAS